jgi:N-acetylmuramoyl-L-alanine amidase
MRCKPDVAVIIAMHLKNTQECTLIKWNRFWPVVALLLFLVLPASPSTDSISIVSTEGGEYLPLDEMTAALGLDNTFDMVAQKGKLYLKNHQAIYAVGLSVVLVDGLLYKSDARVRRSAGKVLVPLDAAAYIARTLDPDVSLERKQDRLVIRRGSGDTAPDRKESPPPPGARDRISFIVIDPGHGGRDPGAMGKGGVREKDITLKVARLVEKRIRTAFPSLRVVVTRVDDRFIELSRRTEIANRQLSKKENGLFVSIHVNSSLSGKISGSETYFLSQNPTNEDARNTAALENNVIILEEKSKQKKNFDDVDYIEAMMITTQIQKESAALAGAIQGGLAKSNTEYGARGVKKADFFVLRGALMPAALVEIGYISHEKEARSLQTESHQKAIAGGIAGGVELFISRYNSLIKVQ